MGLCANHKIKNDGRAQPLLHRLLQHVRPGAKSTTLLDRDLPKSPFDHAPNDQVKR